MEAFFDNYLQSNAAPDGPAARRAATVQQDLFADDLLFAPDPADRLGAPLLPSGGSYAAPADLLSPAATPNDAEQRGRPYEPFILEPAKGQVVPSSIFDVDAVAAPDGFATGELRGTHPFARILALEAEVRRMQDAKRDLEQARDAAYYDHLRAQRDKERQIEALEARLMATTPAASAASPPPRGHGSASDPLAVPLTREQKRLGLETTKMTSRDKDAISGLREALTKRVTRRMSPADKLPEIRALVQQLLSNVVSLPGGTSYAAIVAVSTNNRNGLTGVPQRSAYDVAARRAIKAMPVPSGDVDAIPMNLLSLGADPRDDARRKVYLKAHDLIQLDERTAKIDVILTAHIRSLLATDDSQLVASCTGFVPLIALLQIARGDGYGSRASDAAAALGAPDKIIATPNTTLQSVAVAMFDNFLARITPAAEIELTQQQIAALMMIKDIPESVQGNTVSSELKMVIEKVVREHSTGLEEEIPKALSEMLTKYGTQASEPGKFVTTPVSAMSGGFLAATGDAQKGQQRRVFQTPEQKKAAIATGAPNADARPGRSDRRSTSGERGGRDRQRSQGASGGDGRRNGRSPAAPQEHGRRPDSPHPPRGRGDRPRDEQSRSRERAPNAERVHQECDHGASCGYLLRGFCKKEHSAADIAHARALRAEAAAARAASEPAQERQARPQRERSERGQRQETFMAATRLPLPEQLQMVQARTNTGQELQRGPVLPVHPDIARRVEAAIGLEPSIAIGARYIAACGAPRIYTEAQFKRDLREGFLVRPAGEESVGPKQVRSVRFVPAKVVPKSDSVWATKQISWADAFGSRPAQSAETINKQRAHVPPTAAPPPAAPMATRPGLTPGRQFGKFFWSSTLLAPGWVGPLLKRSSKTRSASTCWSSSTSLTALLGLATSRRRPCRTGSQST